VSFKPRNDGSRSETDADRNKVTRADKAFVHDLAVANMVEVELGKLAPERSRDTEVKNFAQLIVDDHTKSLNGLKGIAAQHNVKVPTAPNGSLNEWAAATYPIVRAHLDAARLLKIAVDKRPRTTN
jgi:predicted outer membrane protein